MYTSLFGNYFLWLFSSVFLLCFCLGVPRLSQCHWCSFTIFYVDTSFFFSHNTLKGKGNLYWNLRGLSCINLFLSFLFCFFFLYVYFLLVPYLIIAFWLHIYGVRYHMPPEHICFQKLLLLHRFWWFQTNFRIVLFNSVENIIRSLIRHLLNLKIALYVMAFWWYWFLFSYILS